MGSTNQGSGTSMLSVRIFRAGRSENAAAGRAGSPSALPAALWIGANLLPCTNLPIYLYTEGEVYLKATTHVFGPWSVEVRP